jgi:hypothetical protein
MELLRKLEKKRIETFWEGLVIEKVINFVKNVLLLMLLNTRLELIGLEESFIIGLAFGHEKIYFH